MSKPNDTIADHLKDQWDAGIFDGRILCFTMVDGMAYAGMLVDLTKHYVELAEPFRIELRSQLGITPPTKVPRAKMCEHWHVALAQVTSWGCLT